MKGEQTEKEPEIRIEHDCPTDEVAALTFKVHLESYELEGSTVEDSKKRIQGLLAKPNATELVLRRDGELIGCAFSFEQDEEGLKEKVPYAKFFTRAGERVFEIKGIVTKSEYRGHGFGQMITEEIMKESREKGATKLVLSTFPEEDNPANRLYKKLGFKEVVPNQHPRNYYMQYEYPEEK